MFQQISKFVGEIVLTLAFIFILLHTDFNDDSVGEWIYYVFGIYGVLMVVPSAIKYALKGRI